MTRPEQAPIVFHTDEDGLEAVPQQTAHTATPPYGGLDRGYARTPYSESYQPLNAAKPERRICGLRRSTFLSSCMLGVVIVIAAVGGAVGGSAAVDNARKAAAAAAATVAPSSTTTTTFIPNSPTPVSTPPAMATNYSVLSPLQITSLADTCVNGGNATSNWNTSVAFRKWCDMDPVAHDIIGLIVYSLSTCLDACLTYNALQQADACVAVVWDPRMKPNIGVGASGNCWLKSAKASSTNKANITAAFLCTDRSCTNTVG